MNSRSRRSPLVDAVAGIQWLAFMFANTVVIPLSVGSAFHQSSVGIAGAMSRSFILTGIACLLQVAFGHRLPLMEGQSGLWWSVVLGLTSVGSASGLSLSQVGGSVAVGMMLGGAIIVVCGLLGLHKWLNRLFTPVVMAVLLFLLASQLIEIFMRGMTGLGAQGQINPKIAAFSLGLVILVSVLTLAGKGLLSNFGVLIGLCAGWLVYVLLFGAPAPVAPPEWQEIRHLFSWGAPSWSFGLIAACVITAVINTTNTVATLRAAEPLFDVTVPDAAYRRSFVLSGVYTFLSGPLGLVAYAPYTSSIGFLRTSRIFDRRPFIIGAAVFTVMGVIPPLCGLLATLPISVGDSVLFVAYLQLFGSALANLEGFRLDYKNVFRIAVPTLTGLAVQSLPAAAFKSLPGFAQSLASNGMLMGILIAVVLERFRWSQQ